MHRIVVAQKTWKRLLSVSAKSGTTVSSLAWRPDGKVLAMGYSSGVVKVMDVETEEVPFDFDPP